ncbi:TPA: YbaB/EbfC family nucleoid-associated protein [Candidatus Ventrenecus stercoripullorum]|nr:YbaB/EbfC family nucleoid-associated protein [Candidatus Ventrenecus stercoripullorum]
MNMQSIMQQAQRMQRDLQKKKDEISAQLFPGKYEFVEVTLNGKKEMVSCKIDKEELSKEDIEMLEDFIVMAMKDSIQKIEKEYEAKLGQYAGMLDGLM